MANDRSTKQNDDDVQLQSGITFFSTYSSSIRKENFQIRLMFSSSINFVLFLAFFVNVPCGVGGKIESTRLRGVQTSLLSLYIPSKPFMCLDGSMTIPFEFVNDDYCDCRDGSDEPGTSACPNGRFYCENKGYVGSMIPSHFVGDGICDCCDGSDEYDRNIVCNNTCFELAQKSQAEREAKRVLHDAGVAKKKEIISQSVAMESERKRRLEQFEQQLAVLQKELKGKEEAKRQAEIPETEAKEKHQKLWEEERARRETLTRDHQIREIFVDLDTNEDSLVSIDELQKHTELDTDKEDEFTVEEVRTILGGEKVNLNEFSNTVFDQISNSYSKFFPSFNIDSSSDGTTSSIATSLDHEKHLPSDSMPDYDEATKQLIQIADQARHDYEEIRTKIREFEDQIDDLKKQSNTDIGPNGEFGAFIDQCYDYEEREYTYRVCMFKEAKQISKGGGSDVTIGSWESWTGPSTNKYERMKYSRGATCWNGPARSLTVIFQCGTEHRILDVREPSRCEYSMLFETPSACDETIASATTHHDHSEF